MAKITYKKRSLLFIAALLLHIIEVEELILKCRESAKFHVASEITNRNDDTRRAQGATFKIPNNS